MWDRTDMTGQAGLVNGDWTNGAVQDKWTIVIVQVRLVKMIGQAGLNRTNEQMWLNNIGLSKYDWIIMYGQSERDNCDVKSLTGRAIAFD